MGTLIKTISSYRKFNSYIELENHVEIPSIQRNIMDKQLHAMRQYIQDSVSKGLEPVFGTLDLVSVKSSNKLYICDGQHRYFAIKKEYDENNIIIPIHCMIYSVDDYESIEEIFRIRNLGVPVPEYYTNLKKQINLKKELVKDISNYLESCPSFNYKASKRPFININIFLEALLKSKIYPLLDSLNDFVKFLNFINTESYTFISGLDEKGRRRYGITSHMLSVWNEAKIYIGYDLNMVYFSEDCDITRFENLLK